MLGWVRAPAWVAKSAFPRESKPLPVPTFKGNAASSQPLSVGSPATSLVTLLKRKNHQTHSLTIVTRCNNSAAMFSATKGALPCLLLAAARLGESDLAAALLAPSPADLSRPVQPTPHANVATLLIKQATPNTPSSPSSSRMTSCTRPLRRWT